MPPLSDSFWELTLAEVEGCRGSIEPAWGAPGFAAGGPGDESGAGGGASRAASVVSMLCDWSCFLVLALHVQASGFRPCATDKRPQCLRERLESLNCSAMQTCIDWRQADLHEHHTAGLALMEDTTDTLRMTRVVRVGAGKVGD